MIVFTPELDSPLIKLWPDGVKCEIAEFTGANIHIRVKLDNHTAKEPHVARVVTTYNRLHWKAE